MKFLVICLALFMLAIGCNQPKPNEEEGPNCDPKVENPYVKMLFCDTVFNDKSYLKIVGDSIGTNVYWGKGDNNQHLLLDTMLDWINPTFLDRATYKTADFIGMKMSFGTESWEDILLPLKPDADVLSLYSPLNIDFKNGLAYTPICSNNGQHFVLITNLQSGNVNSYNLPVADTVKYVTQLSLYDTIYVNKKHRTLHVTLRNNQRIIIKNVEWE